MTLSAIPPGYRREQELRERLDELHAEIKELRSELPLVNEPILRTQAQALAEAVASVVTMYRDSPSPGPHIADDLTGLLGAARAIRVPANDPALGRTPTLERLRKAKGLIVAALEDALEAARALGLHPRQASLRQELPMEVTRSDHQAGFQGIAKRLEEVVGRLDALDHAKAEPTTFPQQTGLLNFYISAMRVEVGLAKLHLTIGEKTIEFGALVRSVEVIAELTRDFFATVRAWVGQVSDAVIRIADELRGSVRRLGAGTKTTAQWIARKQLEISFDPHDPECFAQADVLIFGPGARPGGLGRSVATSIRARVRARSSFTQKNVMAYITKIEKLTASGRWQESSSPDIQLIWVGDTPVVEIPAFSVKYVNILHIDHNDNRLGVWRTPLPPSLEEFLRDAGMYRFTVSVLAQDARRRTRIQFHWQGQWQKLEVLPAP